MYLNWTFLLACLLALLSIDRTIAHQEVTVSVGDNVLLPCSCTTATVIVVWQIGETVVNHFTTLPNKTHEPDALYKNRSCSEVNIEKEECSLILLRVSESDEKNFTCYTLNEDNTVMEHQVSLKIQSKLTDDSTAHPLHVSPDCTPKNDKFQEETQTGASYLPVIGIVIILAFTIIGILLMRRHRQRMQRMENHLDPQSGLPIMNQSPV